MNQITALALGSLINIGVITNPQPVVLSDHQISLENRQPDRFVNSVFKYNILLTLAYLKGDPKTDLEKLNKVEFRLEPGQTFAFHEDTLDKYSPTLVKVTGAHFGGNDGFKSDGYLMGDGVCHLASLIYQVAKQAGLQTEAPVNHNFAVINQIPKEYGAAIYFNPGSKTANARQNVYVTNDKDYPVIFRFDYDGDNLKLSALKSI